MIPHLIKTGDELPALDVPARYIEARGGRYLEQQNDFAVSCVKVAHDNQFLGKQEEYCKLKGSKITAVFWKQIVGFHAHIYKLHSTESALCLFYNPELQKYAVYCPKQEISAAYVEFKTEVIPPDGYLFVGDIHSHPGNSAAHSGVDEADEEHSDGLHIIVAALRSNCVVIEASYCVNGTRFTVKPELVIDNPWVDPLECPEPPKEWVDKCTRGFFKTRTSYSPYHL